MAAAVTLATRVRVTRGAFTLDAEVTAEDGEVVAVLGPNGAGKTTLLRALAGLEPYDKRRLADVGFVFQDHRLFPHLSARDNVAFPLRTKGCRRPRAREAADGWLARLGLAEQAGLRPAGLSGGQAQRVALARALCASPGLLLLDEPLAALDAATRVEVRGVLRQELERFTGPALLVTHDPLDALSLADRVLVLEAGRVVQQAAPHELVRRPATAFVAALSGLNLLHGTAHDGVMQLDGGGALVLGDRGLSGRALAVVRPSAVLVEREQPRGTSARNVYLGAVTGMEQLGDRVRLAVAGPPDLLADVTAAAVADLRLGAGDSVWLSIKATDLEGYPEL
jgi:molybdate transport system ATP-binding protein